jgi:hypothetical protein
MASSDISKKIVYINDDGTISIINPSEEYLQTHSIEELAAKDVPPGRTYYIVDASEIPTDRTFREAWTWE